MGREASPRGAQPDVRRWAMPGEAEASVPFPQHIVRTPVRPTVDVPDLAWTGTPSRPEAIDVLPAEPPGRRLSEPDARRFVARVEDALLAGVPAADVRDAVRGVFTEPAGIDRALDRAADHPDDGFSDALHRELTISPVVEGHDLDARLERLEQRAERERAVRTPVEVSTDPATGTRHLRWRPEGGDGDGDGHILLVEVSGAQVGNENRQLNVVTRVIENPVIDIGDLLDDDRVLGALARLSADPGNPALRRYAVAALAGEHRADEEWTRAYAGTGSADLLPGGAALDGTVAVVRSRAVQRGDRCYQENTIICTSSPIVAATALLGNEHAVNRLIDVVISPGDPAAVAAFEAAVGHELEVDLAASTVARRGYGTVHRPPAAGNVLRVEGATGVSIGHKVSQKTQFAQTAHLGSGIRDAARAAELTRKVLDKHAPA